MPIDIVFTGGGTAGHVTPNIALFPELKRKGYTLAYIGQKDSIEQELISRENLPFYSISAGKLRRYFDWKNFSDVFRIALGCLQALIHLIKVRPKVVFSKGGFVSCPVVWSAWLLRIPVIIHESDMTPGLANKLSAPFAKHICYSFPETLKYLPKSKAVLSGLPVRPMLKSGHSKKGRELCHFQNQKPCIVMIGGSQGARTLNQILRQNLNALLPHYNICHLCGKGELDPDLDKLEGYKQFEYANEELAHLFAMADLVISRAGATSIFELLALHKANLLIPLPIGASRGDQILNAKSFEAQGFSLVLEEETLKTKPETLINWIHKSMEASSDMQAVMKNYLEEDPNLKLISLIQSTI